MDGKPSRPQPPAGHPAKTGQEGGRGVNGIICRCGPTQQIKISCLLSVSIRVHPWTVFRLKRAKSKLGAMGIDNTLQVLQ